jgi:RNA binding exosome subunit
MVKLELTIDVIIHATEDVKKFLDAFREMFGLEEDDFTISHVTGHYDNPIIMLQVKISKKPAKELLDKFLRRLSKIQKKEIIQEIEERTQNSTLHIRFDKQDFIQEKISFKEKEAIRLKIHTPIYNKKETVKVFSDILQLE